MKNPTAEISAFYMFLRGTASLRLALACGCLLATFKIAGVYRDMPVLVEITLPWLITAVVIHVAILLDKRFLHEEGELYDVKAATVSVLRAMIFLGLGWLGVEVALVIVYYLSGQV